MILGPLHGPLEMADEVISALQARNLCEINPLEVWLKTTFPVLSELVDFEELLEDPGSALNIIKITEGTFSQVVLVWTDCGPLQNMYESK